MIPISMFVLWVKVYLLGSESMWVTWSFWLFENLLAILYTIADSGKLVLVYCLGVTHPKIIEIGIDKQRFFLRYVN